MNSNNISEVIIEDKKIPIEKLEEIDSSFKIRSYKQQIKRFEKEGIKPLSIEKVLDDFFNKTRLITKSTKLAITRVYYCPKDRIIILITNKGGEIIRNRDRFTRKYGWFFFVTKKELKKKRTELSVDEKGSEKKKKEHQEITVRASEFQFKDKIIIVKQKKNMRPLYRTKEYRKYINLINEKNVPQMPIFEVLKDFFHEFMSVPIKEKKAIEKINYYEEEKVIIIKSFIGDQMYNHLTELVEKYGWYFYITGVSVGESKISLAIDKIKRKFAENYWENMSLLEGKSLEDIKITLYPISQEPNHNCMILQFGIFTLMLDCGISKEHFEYIKDYLERYPEILLERENKLKNKNNTIQRHDIKDLDNSQEKGSENPAHPSHKLGSSSHSYQNEYFNNHDLEKQFWKENIHEEELMNLDEKASSIQAKSTQVNSLPQKLDAIYISHSHFDHISGLKDLIKMYPDVPILCSRITLDLYLLRDSNFLKQEDFSIIEEEDYVNVVKNVIYVENGMKIKFKDEDSYLAFFHAGHMPGALMLLVKIKDFKFLYTGDYTYWDITPFAGTRRFLDQISKPIDFLLIDGTSAYEEFGDPYSHFDSLILFLEQKAEYGDNTLIGADPSSLAISFMLVFWRYFRKLQLKSDFKKRPNIYVDMMVRRNIQVINHRYEYIYGPISRLIKDKANPFNSIKFRWFDKDDLSFLKKKNNIIISHPPDLSYGIIRNIINVIARNPHNLIFLAGSIHEEPGLSLVEGSKEIVFSDKWVTPLRALLLNTFAPQIKIKLHGDQTQLFEMIEVLEPKEVCFFHQSPYKLNKVAEKVKDMGVNKVSIPHRRKIMILN
ncbi:MAG: MBL fold metallo-hydrolase [Promethearchaeota archaeon]